MKKTLILLITSLNLLLFSCKEKNTNPDVEEPRDYLEYGNVITEGLVAYFPFDGDAQDYSGNENNGIAHGVSPSAGRFDQIDGSYLFDGLDDYIEIPGFSDVNGDFGTICFWVRIPGGIDDNHQAAIFSKIDTIGTGYVLSVYGKTGYWLYLKYPNGSAVGRRIQTNGWYTGRYYFVAFSFHENVVKTYWENIIEKVTRTPDSPQLRFNSNNQPLFIGKSLLSRLAFFKGEIDDVLIYNRALSDDEILELYNWE